MFLLSNRQKKNARRRADEEGLVAARKKNLDLLVASNIFTPGCPIEILTEVPSCCVGSFRADSIEVIDFLPLFRFYSCFCTPLCVQQEYVVQLPVNPGITERVFFSPAHPFVDSLRFVAAGRPKFTGHPIASNPKPLHSFAEATLSV